MRLWRVLGAATLLLLGLLAFTPLGGPGRPEPEVVPAPAQAIVVLGARIGRDGTLSAESLQRAVLGMQLHARGLAPLLVLLGPGDGRHVEAEVRAALARELGRPAAAVLADGGGRTTEEEARRMSELLRPRGIRRVLLVTSPYHMARARRLFEREGFEVQPAPARGLVPARMTPEQRLLEMRRRVMEAAASLYHRLRGA